MTNDNGENVDNENGTQRHPIYKCEPKEDITAYELALCMPVLTKYSEFNVGDKYYIEAMLPPDAKRHFRKLY